jgi:hypothetical protein
VSHQLLDHLCVHTERLYESRERVAEVVPADAFGYTGSCGRRPDESLHDGLGPVRFEALLVWGSPNPVLGFGVDGLLSPRHEHLRNVLIHGHVFAEKLLASSQRLRFCRWRNGSRPL